MNVTLKFCQERTKKKVSEIIPRSLLEKEKILLKKNNILERWIMCVLLWTKAIHKIKEKFWRNRQYSYILFDKTIKDI